MSQGANAMTDSRPVGRALSTKAGTDALSGKAAPPAGSGAAGGPNAMRNADVVGGQTPTEADLDAREARQAKRKRKSVGPVLDAADRPKPPKPVDGPPPIDPV